MKKNFLRKFNSNSIKTIYLLVSGVILNNSVLAQTSYTFTNCGATGRMGPSISQVTAAYAATNLNGLVGTTTGTSGIQTFTIPAGINSATIEAWGAQGGQVGANAGGMGARMRGTFTVTPGQVLHIVVGQMGLSQTTTNCNGGGGGGGSFVYQAAAPQPMVVAGGGGGGHAYMGPGLNGVTTASASTNASVSGTPGSGGNGGGAGTCGSGWPGAGGGGWLTAGGNTCLWSGLPTYGGSTQFSWLGGLRNTNTTQGSQGQDGSFGGGGAAFHGAGGGGGYSGGGGGGSCWQAELPLAGGGGSYNSGTNQSNASGVKTGHGEVIITLSNAVIPVGVSIIQTGSIACFGMSTGALTASVTGGTPPYSYSWSPGPGTSSVISNLAAGVYTVTVTDAGPSTATAVYTLTSPPAITIGINTTSVSCFGGNNGSATVNVIGGTPGYTFSWSPVPGNTSVLSGLSAGNYTASITDANGCPATASASVAQPAAITGNASSNPVCAGSTVTLNGSGATSYTWTGGVTNGVAFSPTATATYSMTGTNSVTGCSGSVAVTVSVNPVPSLTVTGPSTLCAGTSATLTASGASTYSWSNGGNTSSIVVTPASSTSYTVYGTSNGCTGVDSIHVIVSPCAGLSEANLNRSALKVYPNPSEDVLIIETGGEIINKIELTDISGRLILSEETSAANVQINISRLSKGIYNLKVIGSNSSHVLKIIKQ